MAPLEVENEERLEGGLDGFKGNEKVVATTYAWLHEWLRQCLLMELLCQIWLMRSPLSGETLHLVEEEATSPRRRTIGDGE
jgi:hypothetical protein